MTVPRRVVLAVGIALGFIVVVTALAFALWSSDSGGDDKGGPVTTIAATRTS